jgi:hypothetical protein
MQKKSWIPVFFTTEEYFVELQTEIEEIETGVEPFASAQKIRPEKFVPLSSKAYILKVACWYESSICSSIRRADVLEAELYVRMTGVERIDAPIHA